MFMAPRLSSAADTFVGNLSFSACLSSTSIPPGMTARSIADYSKGGAVILYDSTAPLKLLLTAGQTRHFLACDEGGVCKIGDVRFFPLSHSVSNVKFCWLLSCPLTETAPNKCSFMNESLCILSNCFLLVPPWLVHSCASSIVISCHSEGAHRDAVAAGAAHAPRR